MCILIVAKPCKYFQVDRCPFAADICNFAHVLLPPPKDGQSAAVCRHYASGKCQNGPQCRYRHLEHGEIPPAYKPDALRVSIPDSAPGWHGMSSPPDKGYAEQLPLYGHGYSSPYYTQPPHHEWTYAGGISAQSPIYLPIYASPTGATPGAPTSNAVMGAGSKDDRKFYAVGASPITTSTSRSSRDSNATNYSSTSSFEELRDHHHHSDSLSSGSSSSLSSSTSPSTDLEELIIATTEDPKYAEHVHEYQSKVVVTDQPGPVHIPPGSRTVQAFFQGVPVRGLQVQQPQAFHHHQQGYYRSGTPARYTGGRAVTPGGRSAKEAGSNPTSRTASRNSQRKIKPSKYKTKPCKFWALDGTCPSGDECTFRHNEPYPPPVPPLPPNLVVKTSSTINPGYTAPQEDFHRPSHGPVSPQRTRPEDSGNSQNKKEFFPIAWRVIGGGVRVGNPNFRVGGETYSDCTSSESHFAGESVPPSDVEDYHHDFESGPPTAKAPAPAEPRDEDGQSGMKVTAPSVTAPRTRKRSNSIPPTPSSTQFIVGNLFSAESPGVL
ncbi:hypothetical protein EST38_g509 [Candolleomyces aberdarensis]|uniref:C3H1-type domain-containing protein n=1 Tax=Candolleomyces aberdarensis TaxID=2316362 RepID=A0A4Q2E0Y9_9AGAR|nr:hypothetical protein EST38_g509 [Candolleomyces aberdarensis]